MHYFHFLGNDEKKWREVRSCDWNFWHCSGVSLMSFIPTTSFLVIELSSYKSQLFPPDMIHAEEMICSHFLISLCLSHWGKIAKKTETYSAVKHSIQTIVGILQFRQLSSTAVFPPEIGFNWFLKNELAAFHQTPWRRSLLPRYSQIFGNALRCTEALPYWGNLPQTCQADQTFCCSLISPGTPCFSLLEVIDHLSFHSGQVNGEALETSDVCLTEGCSLGPTEVEGDVLEREKKNGRSQLTKL